MNKHSLSTPITKTCQSHNVNGVTFVTRKHMFLKGPIFVLCFVGLGGT